MKHFLLASAAFALLAIPMATPTFAQEAPLGTAANPLRLGAGLEGRGYDTWMRKFVRHLEATDVKIAGEPIVTEIHNLEGSEQIAEAICDDAIDMGLSQIDGEFVVSQQNCNLTVVADYDKMEYAFLYFSPTSSNDALDDFDGDERVLVGYPGSGNNLFARNTMAIDANLGTFGSGWNSVVLIEDDLWNYKIAKAEAVLMVTTVTDPLHAQLVADGWDLGEIYDKTIDNQEFKDGPLYESVDVTVEGDQESVYAVPTHVYVFEGFQAANRQTYRPLMKALSTFNPADYPDAS